MAQGMGFRSLISDFSSGTCRTRFWGFSEKSAFLKDFVGNCTSNILGTTGTHSASLLPSSRSAIYGKISVMPYFTGLYDKQKNFKWILEKNGQCGFSEKWVEKNIYAKNGFKNQFFWQIQEFMKSKLKYLDIILHVP